MSVEFIGMIQQKKVLETHLARGLAIDIDYLRDFAQAHEKAGFDRILVPYHQSRRHADRRLRGRRHAAHPLHARSSPRLRRANLHGSSLHSIS